MRLHEPALCPPAIIDAMLLEPLQDEVVFAKTIIYILHIIIIKKIIIIITSISILLTIFRLAFMVRHYLDTI
jgi:hypothetical protein